MCEPYASVKIDGLDFECDEHGTCEPIQGEYGHAWTVTLPVLTEMVRAHHEAYQS